MTTGFPLFFAAFRWLDWLQRQSAGLIDHPWKCGMQALRPIRKEESSCRSGGNVRWRVRKDLAGLPLQQTLIGESAHQRHQILTC